MSVHVPDIMPFAEFVALATDALKPPRVTAYGRLSWKDMERPGPELEYLIDDWLTVGGKSIIGGPSGSGKSFLAVDTALAIATKRNWFGNDILNPGLVVYQAGEGGLGLKKRFRAYRDRYGLKTTDDVPFEFLPQRIDIFAPDGDGGGDTAKLIQAVNGIASEYPTTPLRAVFIDTLATAQGGADEISGKDMAVVLANIDRINKATGAHVCLVHHMNADGKKLRGHTSIKANIDEVILISRNEQTGVRSVILDKLKDGEDGRRFQFELMSIEVGQRDDGKRITSCVCLPVGEKEAIRKEESLKGFRLADFEIVFMRAFFEAERVKGQPVPPELEVPVSVRSVVSYDDVKRELAKATPNDSVTDAATEEERAAIDKRHREAVKKRVQRAREYLMGAGIIGVASGGVVYYTGRPLRAFPSTLPREQQVPDENVPSGGGADDFPF